MAQPIEYDTPPLMTFTRDRRQFVRGWFYPGKKLTIRYDPYRVVRPGDGYRFGDPGRTIIASMQFRDGGPIMEVALESKIGIGQANVLPNASIDQAAMLTGEAAIPEDADWLLIWFTYHSADGQLLYDSNEGANYRFRFYRRELQVTESTIREDPNLPLNEFVCKVTTDPYVHRVIVRYRITNVRPAPSPKSVDLQRVGMNDEGKALWQTQNELVPNNAVVAYDIIYFADGDSPFKDDNQGNYFLAALPKKLKEAGY